MPRFDCHMLEAPDGPKTPLQFEIPDDEWARILDFVQHVETVLQSRILQEGFRINFNLNFSAERRQFTFSGTLPPDDDVGILLHRMRPFVLQKESTYLPKICKLLARYIENAPFRTAMGQIVAEFSSKTFQQEMKINCNGRVLNSDEMLNNWLNAYEYHHFTDAKSAFDGFRTFLPEGWQRALFLSMMLDKTRAVLTTWMVAAWLERRDGEPLTLSA